MPPATERPEAPPAAPSSAPRATGFSAAAFVVMVMAVVIAAVGGFFLSRTFGQEKTKAPLMQQKYVEVDLGPVRRDLPVGDTTSMLQDTFMVQVVVVINPEFENVDELRAIVEGRRNRLKDKVNEIVQKKSRDYFYASNLLDTLKREIKEQLNHLLGTTKDGQEVISEVLFPDTRTPSMK